MHWSPDGRFLAIGGGTPSGIHQHLEVYSFDGTSLGLLPGTQVYYNISVYSVKWSPNGRYLAVGSYPSGSPQEELGIYEFDGTSLSLNSVDTF